MAAIDLSQAKIGDKFRTKLGYVVIFTGLYRQAKKYKYMFERMDDKYCGCCCDINGVPFGNKEIYTIVEQVFDNPLDAIERDIRTNHEMGEVVEVIKEEENELQRRQEVVELADRIFFSDRGNIYSFKECVEIAEYSVNIRNQYLNEGKLC